MTSSSPLLKPSEATSLLKALEQEWTLRQSYRKLTSYVPYPKQREFHAAGKSYRERLLMAGNQLGKTMSAGAEVAMHLTGRYPDWWDGYVSDQAKAWWVGGVTSESTRDNPQRILLGRGKSWGTGMIPRDALIGDPAMRRGVADAVDHVLCRFGGGADVQAGESLLAFKSYDQGREKWQGETLGGMWFDEEPPEDIYTEGVTRTNVGLGPVMLTFTPLLGMSNVVRRFYPPATAQPSTHVTMMTIDDAEHYTPEQREIIIASYPAHERAARTKGIPQLGSGRVFPLDEEIIKVAPFQIPAHWPQIAGIDFGWDHPTAAVRLAFDRDTDTIYVTAAHRQCAQTPLMFTSAVKPWGAWLPWSWPHDGKQSGGKFDAQDQKQLQALYAGHGLRMLSDHATFEDGTNGVEAGIMDMLDRMQTGRWKVFAHLEDWFEEFRLYHRKDGLIVKENDDLISASRYAHMMRRFARVKPVQERRREGFGQGSWMSA
jgi:phage terminase large subunit-like protein